MKSISFELLSKNLNTVFDQILNHSQTILVKQNNGKDVVIMSYSEFKSYEETIYLLSSQINAWRLFKAIEELNL